MSLFGHAISQIRLGDLQELVEMQAVEIVPLEFEREPPNKDEVLTKLSSSANTYGGILIVGAEAKSNDGRTRGANAAPASGQITDSDCGRFRNTGGTST